MSSYRGIQNASARREPLVSREPVRPDVHRSAVVLEPGTLLAMQVPDDSLGAQRVAHAPRHHAPSSQGSVAGVERLPEDAVVANHAGNGGQRGAHVVYAKMPLSESPVADQGSFPTFEVCSFVPATRDEAFLVRRASRD